MLNVICLPTKQNLSEFLYGKVQVSFHYYWFLQLILKFKQQIWKYKISDL